MEPITDESDEQSMFYAYVCVVIKAIKKLGLQSRKSFKEEFCGSVSEKQIEQEQ